MGTDQVKNCLFFCSTNIDQRELKKRCIDIDGEWKFIPLPCSGKVDIQYLTKAFESRADGVAVVTCKLGECRYLEGNLRARKRVQAVDSLLQEIGLGKGRIAAIQLGDGGLDQVIGELKDFSDRIKALSQEKRKAEMQTIVSGSSQASAITSHKESA